MKIRLRREPSPRSIDASDDHGSMPMALLVTLVGVSLSAILVPVVVNQVRSTGTISARTYALDAAMTGIDTALGQLRAATATATPGVGKIDALPPCAMTGSQDAGRLRYRVTITYHPNTACPPTTVPVTATLTATGSSDPLASLTVGSPGTRTIEATYTFDNSSGEIQLAISRAKTICIDGGDGFPAAGTQVYTQLCADSSHQLFTYTKDRNIKLVGSESAATPTGVCLEAPLPNTTPDDGVTFRACLGRMTRQQWSYIDASTQFEGTYGGVPPVSYCLTAKNAGVPGSMILIESCGNTVRQEWAVPANFATPSALTNITEK